MRNALWILLLMLTACGSAEVSLQIVDITEATALANQQATRTPNPDGLLFYADKTSGLQFFYPATWQVQSEDNRITLLNEQLRLTIAYSMHPTEPETQPQSPAPPASTALISSGSLHLLGVQRPRYIDTGQQRIYYTAPNEVIAVHNTSFEPFMVANFVFAIWLDALQWPLPQEAQQQANHLVESFSLSWLVTPPPASVLASWFSYTDAASDLQFYYPPGWKVTPTASSIEVRTDGALLTFSLDGGPNGLSAGDLRKGEPTHIWLNQRAIPRVHLVFEERVKAVFYGQPITPLAIGSHHVVALLTADGPTLAYEDLDLPIEVRQQADWIVSTLTAP